jgi:hypothetical protein
MAVRELRWYPIAKRLVDFLDNFSYEDGTRIFNTLVDRDSLAITVGKGPTGAYPAIAVLFGEETTSEEKEQSQIVGGLIQLWFDIYIKGENDSTNTNDQMYRQMYDAEMELLNALYLFAEEINHDLGLATNFVCQGIFSDGDGQLPVVLQNRMVLDIRWRK